MSQRESVSGRQSVSEVAISAIIPVNCVSFVLNWKLWILTPTSDQYSSVDKIAPMWALKIIGTQWS